MNATIFSFVREHTSLKSTCLSLCPAINCRYNSPVQKKLVFKCQFMWSLFCILWGRGRLLYGGGISTEHLSSMRVSVFFQFTLTIASVWVLEQSRSYVISLWVSVSDFFISFLSSPHSSLLKSSVEAQCGLVLNGQGGVIRRGKRLKIPESVNLCKRKTLSVSLSLSLPHCLAYFGFTP